MDLTPRPLPPSVESWAPDAVTDEDALPAAPVAALSALRNEPEPVATSGDRLPPATQVFRSPHNRSDWVRNRSLMFAENHIEWKF